MGRQANEPTAVEITAALGLPVILADFVAGEKGRYAIGQPWTRDGYTYATDGRAIVRVPTPGVPDMADDCPETTSTLPWGRQLYEERATALPEVALERTQCDCCDGCPVAVLDIQFFQVGTHRLHGQQIYRLRAHGITDVYLPKSGDPKAPVYFQRADGVSGLLMPCRNGD